MTELPSVRVPPSATPITGPGTLLGLELHVAPTASDRDRAWERGGVPAEESTSVGEIIDALRIGDDDYVLVDTRHWTSGSRRLVPASTLERIDLPGRRCHTVLGRDTIRNAPDFDPFHIATSRYRIVMQNYFADSLGTNASTRDSAT